MGTELLLDYPTPDSYKKFNERMAKGQIPKSSKIGNGITYMPPGPMKNGPLTIFTTGPMACKR